FLICTTLNFFTIRQYCEKIFLAQTKNYSKFCHSKIVGTGLNLAPNKLVQYLKRRSSKLLQDEFKELSKRYWGQYL
ncbi:MAG: hypothetical protein LBJ32_02795, partial [Oscillospiraceae bacterium]|nr:hypothetical protein [Oscillospiraceae bacterium]